MYLKKYQLDGGIVPVGVSVPDVLFGAVDAAVVFVESLGA